MKRVVIDVSRMSHQSSERLNAVGPISWQTTKLLLLGCGVVYLVTISVLSDCINGWLMYEWLNVGSPELRVALHDLINIYLINC